MKIRNVLLAGAAAATISAGASAATLNVLPETPGGFNDFSGDIAAAFGGAANVGFGILTGVTVGTNETLTFTKWGSESGFTNTFTATNGTDTESLTEFGNEPWACNGGSSCMGSFSMTFTGVLASDAFKFTAMKNGSPAGQSAQLGETGMGLYYDLTGSSMFAFLSYDDDGAGPDDNHDDFLVRVHARNDLTVTTVPLPAAAWLFLSALGGFAALGRRKARN
ncbi:MAG: VPLPA-CTERM sorting domain-containing protein [Halieaceae bacterium]|nr:VPLPA-CTERM sorting domain-containing protein [Halieaceae bacterium]